MGWWIPVGLVNPPPVNSVHVMAAMLRLHINKIQTGTSTGHVLRPTSHYDVTDFVFVAWQQTQNFVFDFDLFQISISCLLLGNKHEIYDLIITVLLGNNMK